MLTHESLDLIRQLRAGQFDPSLASTFEQQAATEFVADLKARYPITFRERRIGGKYEVGLARSLSWELARRRNSNSSFSTFFLMPVLRRCLFFSSYGDRITEITTAASLQVVANPGEALDVSLKTGPGHKLDKTPDGWVVKRLKSRRVTLTESFLSTRGWNFSIFDANNIA